jgi:hypothetical protein
VTGVAKSLVRDLIASTPLPLAVLDESFKIVAFSIEFARRFGAAQVELSGKALPELGSGGGERGARVLRCLAPR